MSATLVVAEHDNQQIHAATLHTIAAARRIGQPVHLLVAGNGAQATADAASRIDGIERVLHADAEALGRGLAENLAEQVLAAVASHGYSHVLFAATASGKNVAPRVAARLDVSQLSDIIAVVGPDTFKRPIYAGSAIATVRTTEPRVVATVRTTAFEPAAAQGGSASAESIPAVADSGLSAFVREDRVRSDRPDLTAARVVVSGGRGLGSAENFALLDPLANKLGAAIGASRAAVDSGYAPNDCQVGQTGKIVAPELYIAVGISGAIQHLAGMKDAKTIVAINKDGDAPIFGVADYGLVGDLFDAVPEMTRTL